MSQLAQTGQFCPNPNCDRFNNTHDHALIKHGQTKQDKQRYRCKACGKTFSENKGTIFYFAFRLNASVQCIWQVRKWPRMACLEQVQERTWHLWRGLVTELVVQIAAINASSVQEQAPKPPFWVKKPFSIYCHAPFSLNANKNWFLEQFSGAT